MPITPTPNNPTPNPAPEKTLEQRFAELENEANQLRRSTQAASNLLSDPSVRAVLEAKQRGEEVQVLSKAQLAQLQASKQDDDDQAPVDLNDLEDNNLLANEMSKRLLSSVEKALESKLGPLVNRLTQVEQYATQNIAKTVDQQVQALRAKYRDVKDFEPDMLEISKTSPNLGIEELYILAKTRKNSPITPVSGLESEKPSGNNFAPTRINALSEKKTNRGREGFAELIRKTQGQS
jgi:hypothetical protein